MASCSCSSRARSRRVDEFGVVELAGLQAAGAVAVDFALDQATQDRSDRLGCGEGAEVGPDVVGAWTRAIRSGLDAGLVAVVCWRWRERIPQSVDVYLGWPTFQPALTRTVPAGVIARGRARVARRRAEAVGVSFEDAVDPIGRSNPPPMLRSGSALVPLCARIWRTTTIQRAASHVASHLMVRWSS